MVGDPMITAAGSAQRVLKGKLFEGSPKRHRIFGEGHFVRRGRGVADTFIPWFDAIRVRCARPRARATCPQNYEETQKPRVGGISPLESPKSGCQRGEDEERGGDCRACD